MSRFEQCTRKKSYPSYRQACEVLERMRAQRDPDPTLHVYPCPRRDHYHIGHATGEEAAVLTRRWEKRALRSTAPQGADGDTSAGHRLKEPS